MKFPKTLYVKSEKESSTEYFVADANPCWLVEMGQKIKIAKYQLVEVSEAEGIAQFKKPVSVKPA
jgi:hypothetical protein